MLLNLKCDIHVACVSHIALLAMLLCAGAICQSAIQHQSGLVSWSSAVFGLSSSLIESVRIGPALSRCSSELVAAAPKQLYLRGEGFTRAAAVANTSVTLLPQCDTVWDHA